MAEQLKRFFNRGVVEGIARELARADPKFEAKPFVRDCMKGLEGMELLARGWHVAEAMRRHLPADFEEAAAVLRRSLPDERFEGMAPFRYMPHVFYAAKYGLDHFEAAMELQYELTQRFTAEFSVRAYLERYPEQSLARLRAWTRDDSEHVRRLVSEGTRPRLPWAPRLRAFQRDPGPVLALLELLRDDPSLYVRRSVANNLNDIAKDHPEVAVEVCRRWLRGASAERAWIVKHALRGLVKAGHRGALEALGVGALPKVRVSRVLFTPKSVKIGGKVAFSFAVTSTGRRAQTLQVDYRVHFVKANGKTSGKVFKLRRLGLGAGEEVRLEGRISFAPMTTRKTYPGVHRIEAVVNGVAFALGSVRLQ